MNIRLGILAAIAATASAATIAVAPATADTTAPLTVAVAGDSLSARPDSWMHQFTDPSIRIVGGYQHSGYTTAQVEQAIAPGEDPDVLVIMLGTNDVTHRVPLWQAERNIEQLAAKVRTTHVLLTYLPPSNWTVDRFTGAHRTTGQLVYSRGMVALAARHGWMIADPFAPWRAYTGRWVAGASADGTHPTAAVGAQEAALMAGYIRQADHAANGAGW